MAMKKTPNSINAISIMRFFEGKGFEKTTNQKFPGSILLCRKIGDRCVVFISIWNDGANCRINIKGDIVSPLVKHTLDFGTSYRPLDCDEKLSKRLEEMNDRLNDLLEKRIIGKINERISLYQHEIDLIGSYLK